MQPNRPFRSFPLRSPAPSPVARARIRPPAGPGAALPAWPDGRPSSTPDEDDSLDVAPAASARDEAGPVDRQEQLSSLQLYLNEIGRTALLTPAEEVELAGRIRRGDAAARERMIKANLRLVVRIASDYRHLGLPLLDLISEGNLGLIRAVERFDPARGGKLSTYAGWWIRQSMKRAAANQSKTIRLPVHLIARIGRMRSVINEHLEATGLEPDNDEIACSLRIPVHKVALLKTVSARMASLDAPLGAEADAGVLGDIVGDPNASIPDEQLREKTLSDDLRSAVNSLDPREARILIWRFGLEGEKPMTLEAVGRRFNVTRERVRQLQYLALRQLRRRMVERTRPRSRDEVERTQRVERRKQILREFAFERAARREPSGLG